MDTTPTRVDLYFDPACPFNWIASRWLLEVRRYRHLDLRWHTMSLFLLNQGADVEASYQHLLNQSPGAARVLTAATQWYGEGVLPVLYTALGQVMFTRQNRDIVHNPRVRAEEWAAAMREAIGKRSPRPGSPPNWRRRRTPQLTTTRCAPSRTRRWTGSAATSALRSFTSTAPASSGPC